MSNINNSGRNEKKSSDVQLESGKLRANSVKLKYSTNEQRPGLSPILYIIALVLLASIVAGIPDAWNSVIGYAQTYWSRCSLVVERWWDYVLSITGEDPFVIWVVIPNAITLGIYWTYGTMFSLMDITGKPEFLKKYKLQPGKNDPLDITKLKKALKIVLFNQIVVNIPMSLLFYLLKLHTKAGIPALRPLPDFHVFVMHIVVNIILIEIFVYYSHRFLHHRYIYRYIHKKHHEWKSPSALAAIYTHPLEHASSNVYLRLGIALFHCHAITAWIWFTVDMITVVNGHSGYHFPYLINSEFHDFHHLKSTECFGMAEFLDWLHGTDKLFRKYKEDLRRRKL